jgi:sporulation protein YlmC with PRC-barrel domain
LENIVRGKSSLRTSQIDPIHSTEYFGISKGTCRKVEYKKITQGKEQIMRKTHIFLSLIVMLGMLLASCSGSQNQNGTPGVSGYPYPGNGTQQSTIGVPVTGGTQQPTTTEMATTETTSTEMATQALTSTVSTTPAVTSTQAAPTTGASNQQMDPGRLSNELKFQVMDQNNQSLGQVEDMVLDLQNLKVEYVIVGLSQTSSTTQTQVAVPWDMLQVQTQASGQSSGQAGTTPTTTLQTSNPQGQGAFIFQGDAQKLSGAPAFTQDMLPPLGQPAGDWDSSIRSYWSQSGSAAATSSPTEMPTVAATQVTTPTTGSSASTPSLQGVILASKVIGFSISPNNQPIASVEDVIVDVNTGDLKYVVLSVSGIPGLNNKLIPIPPQILSYDTQNQTFTIDVDPQALQKAPGFDQNNFPLTTQSNWDSNIQSYWQSQVQMTPQQ